MTRSEARAVSHPTGGFGLLRALLAGGAYFAAAFLLGWAVGLFRETVVAPHITSDLAIGVETPFMAWAAFHIARYSARRLFVPPSMPARLFMGSIALGLLVWAEDVLSHALRDRSVFEQWGLYGYLAAGATFVGLAWFWLAPLIAARGDRR